MSEFIIKSEKTDFLIELSEQQQELIAGAGHYDCDDDYNDDCDNDYDRKGFGFGDFIKLPPFHGKRC